mmetsp:Transcript_36547/g.96451  ORF Transcript_36547/g.96451 Transcript_36547/m.96451 type:complete len:222 (+) Transcript_36547:111-776(+)
MATLLEKNKLRQAFKTFDTDGSGTLSKDELINILTREGGGAALSPEVAEALIAEFDKNGDGVLDVDEFIECWSAVGTAAEQGDLTTSDGYTNDMYDRIFKANKDGVTELFEMLDTDESQFIEIKEMKDVVAFYQGEAFVESDFLAWYDSNANDDSGEVSDGKFDLKEFGWYIADCAECVNDKMPEVIAEFKKAIEYINEKKNRKSKASTKDLFSEVDGAKK